MNVEVFFHTNVLVYAPPDEALGARTVYSEDLNNGQQYAQVKVVNPFR